MTGHIWQVMQDSSVQTLTGTWTITATDGEFNVPAQLIFVLTIDATALSVLGESALPEAFALYQNYPNPFNPYTTISYDLPERADVTIVIFNLIGQEVKFFNAGILEPGRYHLRWNGTDNRGYPTGAGIYLYRINAGRFNQTRKMILTK